MFNKYIYLNKVNIIKLNATDVRILLMCKTFHPNLMMIINYIINKKNIRKQLNSVWNFCFFLRHSVCTKRFDLNKKVRSLKVFFMCLNNSFQNIRWIFPDVLTSLPG